MVRHHTPEDRKYCRAEVENLKQLDHKGVLKIFEVIENGDETLIITE